MAATSVPPARRSVTERSPSCTGSTVYSRGSAFGGQLAQRFLDVGERGLRVELPATISTALSGW